MSVPSKRRSSSRGRRGRAHLALKKMRLVACPKCKKKIKPHQVCPFCGSYQGREVLKLKIKGKKANSKKEKK